MCLCRFAYGPVSGRRHDAHLFHESGLGVALRNLVIDGRQCYMCVRVYECACFVCHCCSLYERLRTHHSTAHTRLRYGDLAFPLGTALLKPFSVVNTAGKRTFNHRMNGARASIEHSFAKVTQLWSGLDALRAQKMLQQSCGVQYAVALVLTNWHTIVYGSQMSCMFDVFARLSLSQYMNAQCGVSLALPHTHTHARARDTHTHTHIT